MTRSLAIEEEAWSRAVAAVRDADRVSLACHIGPDGDALGSMLAVGIGLRSLGKTVHCSWGQEPQVVPAPMAEILPGLEMIVRPHDLPDAPLFIAFDTGALDRLGELASRAKDATTTIVLDHHVTNDGFADVDLMDPAAEATAVISRELLRRLDVPLTEEIARCLYVALVTDTGRFQYASTSPATHELAAELLAAGVEQDSISRVLYETRTLGAMRAIQKMFTNMRIDQDASMVWSSISLTEIGETGATRDDLDGLIDQLRVLDTCDVALILKQAPDGGWRGSMRSKGAHDVAAVAASFGGGGHRLAAGFTAPKDLSEPQQIADAVRARLAGS